MIYEVKFKTSSGNVFSQQFKTELQMEFWKEQNNINRGLEHYELLSETVLLQDDLDCLGWKFLGVMK